MSLGIRTSLSISTRRLANSQLKMSQVMSEDLLAKISRIVDVPFSQRILRESESDPSIEVKTVSIKPATNKGDNYTSDMFRVSVEYTSKNKKLSKTLIVKTEPLLAGPLREMISKSSLFTTESYMMSDTLAKMNDLLGNKNPLNGRGLYVQKRDPPMLVIEDLAPLGFRMADRQAGLDMDHCLLAIRNLARFHAASVALCEREPQQKGRYTRGSFNRSQPVEIQQFFIQGTRQLAEEAATWPELDPKIPEKIRRMADKIYELGCDACECRDDEFNVINHGDCWVNNLLFRYNESHRPIAQIFVDFQLCLYSSPGVDLNNFFNTSLTDDTLRLNEDTLLYEYTRTLAAEMAAMGCNKRAPSFEQVKQMLQDRIAYGMVAAFTILPLVLVSKSEAQDFNEMLAEGAKNPLYSGALFREAMLNRLPKFDKLGLLG